MCGQLDELSTIAPDTASHCCGGNLNRNDPDRNNESVDLGPHLSGRKYDRSRESTSPLVSRLFPAP